MDELADTTVSKAEAAALLGISERQLDRDIPPGTPGRYPTIYRPNSSRPVRFERALIKSRMTTPGGDTTDDTD